MLRILIFYFFFSLFSVSHASPLDHQEEIGNFSSKIVVNKNNSIDVYEKIVLYANQNQIKNGIIRYLPAYFITKEGTQILRHYKIHQILINNISIPYRTQIFNNYLAIYIGDQAKKLESQTYSFTLQYHVENAIHSSKKGNEFYWNVTGHEWNLPIVNAEIEITLPSYAKILKTTGNTGSSHNDKQNFITLQPTPNKITFQMTRELNAGENFSIGIGWPTDTLALEPVDKTHQNGDGIIFKILLLFLAGGIQLF